ncbi:MAG: ATP phosphoribosyltransferase [Melioribacteraceae bacterium]|nr:ATP phosphoribosyltransferase [Melioribacteraceae bacterium]MCF8354301.1 ATP phosphoribosyltransferase [Melioribacteraceae bacterium]MCF8394567.1 ATP phosphoribosyltransferase [Melioribacteraceae bacterium]MCF8419764.1 ATP phosphoribosyltransferase [Melioribacteraceae bacterium]
MNGHLKIAVQKKGRLADKSLELLKRCGLEIENYNERLFVSARNFDLDILFLRDDDIPEYVQDGVADIGIVGENVVREKRSNLSIERKLGFSKCRLMLASPENIQLDALKELSGKSIATSHPNILSEFLDENKISAKVIQISGSVEIAPSVGIADFICDLVSTGNTLKFNKLKQRWCIFESEAVLIKNNSLNNSKSDLYNNLLKRIDSSLTARKSKYIMMNIPKESLESVTKIIPSLKSPTVLPLADETSLAVHAVIPTDKFWEIIDELKMNGASGILSLPIENMIS